MEIKYILHIYNRKNAPQAYFSNVLNKPKPSSNNK